MATLSSRFPSELGSAQVWGQLDADLRQQAISVVAQMAFNVVKIHPEHSQQEVDDDHSNQLHQAPQ